MPSQVSAGKRSGKKSKSKGAKGESITHERGMKTQADYRMLLRNAIFNPDGTDRNVLADIKPFAKYTRNGLNLEFEFSPKLNTLQLNSMLRLSRTNMTKILEESGDEWSKAAMRNEMQEPGARFFLIRDMTPPETSGDDKEAPGAESHTGRLIGYVHFRFSVQGEFLDEMFGKPALLVYDIQLEPGFQRKGVGQHVFNMLELTARKHRMSYLMINVPQAADAADNLINEKLKGYSSEDAFDFAGGVDLEDSPYIVYSKCLEPAPKPAVAAPAAPKTGEAAGPAPSKE